VPVPFPLRLTLEIDFFGSLVEILIVALLRPTDVGLNVAVMAHELPFATVEQPLVWPNSSAFVPAMVIVFTVRSDVPVFLIVTILGADVEPAATEPKLTDVGETVIVGGGACPKSCTLMVCFLGSVDEILMIALFLPKGTVGLKVTAIGHEFFAGIVEQLFVWLNSERFAPVIVIELIVRTPLPVFLIVTVLGLDILPALTEPKLTDTGLMDILGALPAFTELKMIAGNKITTIIAANPKTFFIAESPFLWFPELFDAYW
jgi:hypothetical protein